MFARIKNAFYNFIVRKNKKVQKEYEGYVNSHKKEHKTNRLKHWWILFRLNWHYRVLRKSNTLLPEVKEKKSAAKKTKSPAKNKPAEKKLAAAKGKKKTQPTASASNKPAEKKPAPSANKVPVIKPYSGGPESTKRLGADAYHFALGLMGYDIISFDIFDTLILRKLDEPMDVFMLVGERLGVFDYYNIRRKAEQEARERNKAIYGTPEVTIEEIYERVAFYTGIDADHGVAIEFETELDMCFANPYMLQVFEILKAARKRIVVTSNMYLQAEKIGTLLKHCGYDGIESIFVSCDYYCGKGNGDLFRVLISQVEKNVKIVHIGDNMGADIAGAKKVGGIDTRYYPSCRELGSPHRSPGLSWFIQATYRGIINTTLHNGTETFSSLWEYGFVYGGLAAVGYVNWIHRKAAEDGITKILFIARDGFVLKKIYDKMFQDIPSEYVYWSRIAAYRNVHPGERESFLRRVIGEQCGSGVTIAEMLSLVGLEELSPLFKGKGLSPTIPIMESNQVSIFDFFVKHWTEVETIWVSSREKTWSYIRSIIGNNKRIAIVDMGWSGKSLGPLLETIHDCEEYSDVQGKIYMLGSLTTRENSDQFLKRDIECYLFSGQYNREIRDRVRNESVMGLETIEKLFNAPHCSFLGFSGSGEMEFALPEADNYAAFSEIEAGIIEFCERYCRAFGKYPYLLQVDGYDAYIPLRLLFNHKTEASKLIGSLSYNLGIVPSNRFTLDSIIGGKK